MRLSTLLFSLVASFNFTWCKIFEKCELASELVTKYNVSSEEVKSLVCIAEYESTFNSAAINHFNWDGSKDFGLFQLNNNFWCGKEFGQNVCKTSCESFLDDDLTDDLRCVQIIVKDTKRWMKVNNGYVAWVAYVNRCQNRNLDEYMSECTTALTTTTVATSKAPVVTTVKPDLTITTTRTSRVPPKAQAPIRTSQQKPDQVRGPQIPIFKPIPATENKPQTETQVPIRTSQQKPDQVRGPQIPIFKPIPATENKPQTETQVPIRTSQQKPDHVRGPQIPIFKPISPVRENKPQTETQVPIRTSQQKPDQVRGPQIPIFKPIPATENKPQTETQVPIRTSQQKPDHVRGPQIPIFKPISPVRENKPQTETQAPIRTSEQKPDQVRGPQIPIFKPIPVRESKPQTDIQTSMESENVHKPSKAPLKNIEGPQFINPLSVMVVEELLHILTDAISQFDFKPIHISTQTGHKNDNEAQLPSNEFVHPQIDSLAVSDGESNFGNLSPELHDQEGVVEETNLSNLLNDIIFGALGNTNSPNLNVFTKPTIDNPSKGLTRFYTKKPAGVPIVNHYPNYPLEFPPILEQIRSPYLALNRQKYNPIPMITSPGTFPQIFITGYGIYNPYQNFPPNRNVFFKQTPTHDSYMYPGPSYAPLTPYLPTHNNRF